MRETGESDTLVSGFAQLSGHETAITALDFAFLRRSMGVVVGEELVRLAEQARKRKLPLITISARGGAHARGDAFPVAHGEDIYAGAMTARYRLSLYLDPCPPHERRRVRLILEPGRHHRRRTGRIDRLRRSPRCRADHLQETARRIIFGGISLRPWHGRCPRRSAGATGVSFPCSCHLRRSPIGSSASRTVVSAEAGRRGYWAGSLPQGGVR